MAISYFYRVSTVKRKDSLRQWLEKRGVLVAFAVAFLLYANTLPNGYTQDDAIVITQNVLTKQGLKGIPGLLTKDTFYGFFQVEGKSRLVAGGRYRPLTPVMFAVEYQLFGERPWIGHFMNALLFALSAMVVFIVTRILFRLTGKRSTAVYVAMVCALLFASHPIHTEVVANIKGRDEIMSFLLAMVALLATLRSVRGDISTSLALPVAGLSFFLALLSKENAITFLAIVPFALIVLARQNNRSVGLQIAPYIAATAVFLLIRGMVIGWDLGDPPREMLNNPFIKIEDQMYVDFSTGEKFATIFYTLGKYVQLLVFPHPLTHDYYPRHIPIMRWTDWQVWLSVAAYIGLIAGCLLSFRRKAILSFAIFFYLASLSIVSNIVFPVGTNMSERFAYMPSYGFLLGVSVLVGPLIKKRNKVAIALLALIFLAFSVKTIMRNTVWKSNYTLFTTDIETSEKSIKLLAAAGGELITRAGEMPEGPERDAQIRRGLDYLIEAQEMHPNYKMSYLLRGNGHYYLKEWNAAIASFQRVVEMEPGNEEGRRNLGITYRDAGKYFGQELGDYPKAIEYLRRAVQYLPNEYETVHSLGVAYGLNGQPAQAVEMFRRGVELSPENAMAHYNLGLAYQGIGDIANAQKHREIAIQLDPDILNRRSIRE